MTSSLSCGKDDGVRPDTIHRLGGLKLELVRTFPAHRGYVFYTVFSPDGKWLASGGADATIRVWETGSWAERKTIVERYNEVWGIPLAFSPDSRYLAAGSYEVLKLYLVRPDFAETAAQSAHPRGIQSVAFSPDNRTIASAGVDGMIRTWTVPELSFVSEIRAHSSEVWSICFTPDGKFLVSGGEDNAIRIWSYPELRPVQEIKFHTRPVEYVRVSPDGRLILAASGDSSVSVWKWGEYQRPWQVLRGHMGGVLVAEFNPRISLIFTGGDDDSIYAYAIDTGEMVYQLKEHFGDIMTLAFSPDGRLMASGSRDRTVKVWSVAN